MNLQVKDFGKLYFGMKSTTSKTEEKVVEMPASKIKLTEEEFDKLLGVSTTTKAIPAATATSIK
jgi:orotate phosphoribosyltransferase